MVPPRWNRPLFHLKIPAYLEGENIRKVSLAVIWLVRSSLRIYLSTLIKALEITGEHFIYVN